MDYVLSHQTEALKKQAKQAYAGSATRNINLTQTIPVKMTYLTTLVNKDGEIEFYEDVYRRNDKLELAMRKAAPQFAMIQ